MKKTGSKLVLSILAAVFAALSFVGFALPYMATVASYNGTSQAEGISRKDWVDVLKSKEASAMVFGNKSTGLSKFANTLQILAVVLLVAILVLVIVSLFVEHKALRISTKACAITAIVLVSLFIIVLFLGGATLSTVEGKYSVVYVPSSGAYLFFVFGLVSSILGLVSIKKAKAK